MRKSLWLAGLLAPALLASPALGEPLVYGIQVEENEYRLGDGSDIYAWNFDALVGTDEWRLVWRSEAELTLDAGEFDSLQNQARVQTPITTFFDAVAGVRFDTPEGPDSINGVIGLHGLAPQFVEMDLDLFVSEDPFMVFEAEIEGLITNRVTLTPSLEFELPFTDDPDRGVGNFDPTLELGLRLGYDLIDRAVSPYVGVFYERAFGETAAIAREEGENAGTVYFVIGTRLMF